MRVQRSKTEPPRANPSWAVRWGTFSAALVTCWERGRELAIQDASLAAAARDGELVPLSWKGGIAPPARSGSAPKRKYGSFYYLATWQGLRGDDLDIDTAGSPQRICSRNGTVVTFTDDVDLLDK
jgi:hypothetical protein